MPQLIKVRPTKIELIRLRRRLSLSQRIQKIVKDRLSILTMEFLLVAGETVKAKENVLAHFSAAYKAQSIMIGYYGDIALEKELLASEKEIVITGGSRSIAGTIVPSFELEKPKETVIRYNLADTSSWFDQSAQLFEKCLESIVTLAELQSCLERLGREINRTKRIVNALEHLTIPNLKATIKYLNMKFEERDREEKSRLKRVKVLIERR
jgi:V/A-type H+-transporting ATPase subunit D